MKPFFAIIIAPLLLAVALRADTVMFAQIINESGLTFTTIEAIADRNTTFDAPTDGGIMVNSQYIVWKFDPASTDFTFTLSGSGIGGWAAMNMFALNGPSVVDGRGGISAHDNTGLVLYGLSEQPGYWEEERQLVLANALAPEPASFWVIVFFLAALLQIKHRATRTERYAASCDTGFPIGTRCKA